MRALIQTKSLEKLDERQRMNTDTISLAVGLHRIPKDVLQDLLETLAERDIRCWDRYVHDSLQRPSPISRHIPVTEIEAKKPHKGFGRFPWNREGWLLST
jgi:hypothetical protein